jgi:peptidoglycan hydrolase CwlO-like protein
MTVETFLLVWLPIIVSASAFCFSVYMGLKGNRKTDENEIAQRIARDTRTEMKLDEMSKDIKEIKETVKNIQNDVKDHEGRIVKLEASLKAVHKRLDEIFHPAKSKEGEVNA